ncbi:MAG: MarR family winged helix-turn-helix transcriptional regulator [Mycobacteriaceae bacterium]
MVADSALPFDPIAEARRQWQAHGWGEVADGMAAITSVMRAHQIMLARVEEVLKPHGLTFSRYEMLALLTFTQHGSIPMAKASARLQVHPTSVTNTVDRLESAGLVQRVPHPSDGRGTLIAITESGRALAERATTELNRQVFASPGIPARRINTLVSVLTELRRGAGDFDDKSVRPSTAPTSEH